VLTDRKRPAAIDVCFAVLGRPTDRLLSAHLPLCCVQVRDRAARDFRQDRPAAGVDSPAHPQLKPTAVNRQSACGGRVRPRATPSSVDTRASRMSLQYCFFQLFHDCPTT